MVVLIISKLFGVPGKAFTILGVEGTVEFIPPVYWSSKQFGFSFAYDSPKVWNEMPDDMHSATSFLSFLTDFFWSCFLVVGP